MNGHDLKMLAVIGISGVCGMGLTSALLQGLGPVEEVEFVIADVTWESPEVAVETKEIGPEVAMWWWTKEAPMRTSGLGSVKIVRPTEPSLWKSTSFNGGILRRAYRLQPSGRMWKRMETHRPIPAFTLRFQPSR